MYIRKLSIRNIRSISTLDWELESEECAGWHVFIGDNGSGKSTILRAAALALIGDQNAEALRQDWNVWLTSGQARGQIDLTFTPSNYTPQGGFGPEVMNDHLRIEFIRNTKEAEVLRLSSKHPLTSYEIEDHFSAAFGPFRRFSGNTTEYKQLIKTRPTLAAHLSVFGEDFALTEPLEWLIDLNYKRLENRPEGNLLADIKQFINQDGFLPHNAKFSEVSSDGVRFTDARGNEILAENLSDGFRSILSMTFEIIRQLTLAFPVFNNNFFSKDHTRIVAPGIVLIDEVDAHLHPTWQKRIGFWFREHFPNMQFIVTTHSPLICQAADKGSVWKLPTPGTDETCQRVTGQELNRLLYGNILEAYSTELFGITTTRSPEAQDKLERLAELNLKEVFAGLNDEERTQQQELRDILPTVANSTTVANGSAE